MFRIVIRFLSRANLSIIIRNIGIMCMALIKHIKRSLAHMLFSQEVSKSIFIYLSMKCNLNCSGCISSQFRENDDNINAIDAFVSTTIAKGTHSVTFLGGEPLLPEIQNAMFNIIAQHHLTRFIIFTNGTIQDDDTITNIKNHKNIFLCISIDGDRIMHNKRRGQGTFEKTQLFCEKLKTIKIPFALSCTLTTQNYSSVLSADFQRFAESLGAIFIIVLPYCPIACSDDEKLSLSKEKINAMHNTIMALNAQSKCIFIDSIHNELATQGCGAGINRIAILPTGDVLPCPGIHYSFANIINDRYEAVFENEFIQQLSKLKQKYHGCLIVDHIDELRSILNCHSDVKDVTAITCDVISKGGITTSD